MRILKRYFLKFQDLMVFRSFFKQTSPVLFMGIGLVISCSSPNTAEKHEVHVDKEPDHKNSYKLVNGDTLNKVDKDGLDQGHWERVWEDGTLRCHGAYKDGKKEGYWERKYPNGNWEYQVNMKGGYPNGFCKAFYENGNIKQEADYKEGLFNGNVKKYNEKGIMISEENYKDGVLYGYCKYYSDDETLKREGNMVDGKNDGTWKYNNSKGEPEYEVIYNKGKAMETKTIKK